MYNTKLNAARYLLSTVSSILYNISHYIATYIDYKYTGGTLFFNTFLSNLYFDSGPLFSTPKKILVRKLAKMDKNDQNMVQKHD